MGLACHDIVLGGGGQQRVPTQEIKCSPRGKVSRTDSARPVYHHLPIKLTPPTPQLLPTWSAALRAKTTIHQVEAKFFLVLISEHLASELVSTTISERL